MTGEHGYARRTARVLLLDGAGRVLLLGYGQPPEWLTPGGGVDPGETLRKAAVRELREEIGLAVDADELGPRVAKTSGYAELGWVNGVLRDDFFLYRVNTLEVDTSGLEPHELQGLIGYRWWSAGELAATTHTVYPVGLAKLVDELARGRIPTEPVRLPWHH